MVCDHTGCGGIDSTCDSDEPCVPTKPPSPTDLIITNLVGSLSADVRRYYVPSAVGTMKYVKQQRVILKSHPQLTERWVQDRIADDPAILGLGDLMLKDKERIHPQAGRLDLLLRDPDSDRRYEVEIQLGRTDESHIIRTLEYWDIERKRYPQYDHVAVIVAEEITSRFLNVIGLFNGYVPLIAIQMHAYAAAEDAVSLIFTTVLSERQLGTDEEDELPEPTDRAYWEARVGRASLESIDVLTSIVKSIDPAFTAKYTKGYVGLARDGQPLNFVIFAPKRQFVRIELRLDRSEEVQSMLDQSGIDFMNYNARNQRYQFRLHPGDTDKHAPLLGELFRMSYAQITR